MFFYNNKYKIFCLKIFFFFCNTPSSYPGLNSQLRKFTFSSSLIRYNLSKYRLTNHEKSRPRIAALKKHKTNFREEDFLFFPPARFWRDAIYTMWEFRFRWPAQCFFNSFKICIWEPTQAYHFSCNQPGLKSKWRQELDNFYATLSE